ncbi:MAG: helix-hairpin-helix domain-containing protein [Eubacterium sp.]|nr:helix-hairpin-helix domain-containing protein [Eubacterium sp.]
MKSDKKQSLVMIGIVMLIIAGIVLYVTISAPDVYENEEFITSVSTTMKTEKTTVSYPLNLNTASAEELMTIDGISEKTANAIIRYREENGLYSDVSEIMNIKGIGEETYIKALPFLEV